MVNPTRTIKVNLLNSVDGNRMDLKNGNFEVKVNGELDQHSFYFDVLLETDANRSMIISNQVLLFKPDFSRRYLINLGSFAPQGLWWNRRIFIESEKDSGNYHAFLYAHLENENSEIQKEFLGYATLDKINDENASNSLSEYRLSIPINLTRFFHNKIIFIELNIYQYEESKYSLDTLKIANETKDICTICLDPIIESQFIIKLHGENGNKSAHIFHKDCVKKWFDNCIRELRCPFCNQGLKSVMTVLVPSRFERVPDSFSNLYFNSISKLFQISNGSNADDAFKQKQAEFGIKYIMKYLREKEEKLKMRPTFKQSQSCIPVNSLPVQIRDGQRRPQKFRHYD
uniref:RING-type domain-containing protein n=1 Tax=Globodera rostochiensis TaxID=31243 RepID=A0A914IET1_GLORO